MLDVGERSCRVLCHGAMSQMRFLLCDWGMRIEDYMKKWRALLKSAQTRLKRRTLNNDGMSLIKALPILPDRNEPIAQRFRNPVRLRDLFFGGRGRLKSAS